MSDLLVGFGLVFVIEGLLWALAPKLGFRLLELAASANEHIGPTTSEVLPASSISAS